MKSLLFLLTLMSLLSCTLNKDKDKGQTQEPEEIPFPHPEGFDAIDQHGFWTLKNSAEGCKSCHGADLKGKESANSCYECHESYPHTEWEEGKHASITSQEMTQTCLKCHNSPENAGLAEEIPAPPSCVSCHAGFPHSEGWNLPNQQDFHGKAVLELGTVAIDLNEKSSCIQCHKIDQNDPGPATKATPCKECHESYPHTDWEEGKHPAITTDEMKSNCLTCHSTETGVDTPAKLPQAPSCFSCHSGFPHTEGWLLPGQDDFHGKAVLALGAAAIDLTVKHSCIQCHKLDSKDPGPATSDATPCKDCHAAYPHTEKMEPLHYSEAYNLNTVKIVKECSNCHLTDRAAEPHEQTFENKSCHSCHNFPHNPATWAIVNSQDFHGDKFSLENSKDCQMCHGDDYKGNGDVKKNCFQCHSTYPHSNEFKNSGKHGEFIALENPNEKRSCENCHGVGMTGGKTGKSCNSCHTNYPHSWSGDRNHGEMFVDSIVNGTELQCQLCHGDDLLGKNLIPSCSSCHTSYPHDFPKVFHVNSTTAEKRHECQACHVDGMQQWSPPNPSCGGVCHSFQ